MADTDPLLERLHEGVLRLADTRPRRVTPAIDDTPERTRQAIRQLARSRVSAILRQLRAAHGLTYEEIQQRTGLSQQLLFDVEFKERRLNLDELRRLADCYGASVSDILGIDVD
jgi:ribosome-binding protein aMBF1 (putative translation factor)